MKKGPFILCAFLALNTLVQAELIVNEPFNYHIGNTLNACGAWYVTTSGVSSQIVITNAILFDGYEGSDTTSNAVLITDDVSNDQPHLAFPHEISSGNVYAAFIVQPTLVYKKGWFFSLRDNKTEGWTDFNFNGRVFMDTDYHIGLALADNQKAEFTSTALDPQKTYLVVLKYTIIPGEKNDQVALYVFDKMPSEEPTSPTIGPLTDNNKTDINPANLVLHAFDGDGWLVVDGIRVATTWSEAAKCIHSTAIHSPDSDLHSTKKYIRPNGQLVIHQAGQDYDIQGNILP